MLSLSLSHSRHYGRQMFPLPNKSKLHLPQRPAETDTQMLKCLIFNKKEKEQNTLETVCDQRGRSGQFKIATAFNFQ